MGKLTFYSSLLGETRATYSQNGVTCFYAYYIRALILLRTCIQMPHSHHKKSALTYSALDCSHLVGNTHLVRLRLGNQPVKIWEQYIVLMRIIIGYNCFLRDFPPQQRSSSSCFSACLNVVHSIIFSPNKVLRIFNSLSLIMLISLKYQLYIVPSYGIHVL